MLSNVKSMPAEQSRLSDCCRQMCGTQSGTDTSKFLSVARVRFTLSDCAALAVEPHLAAGD